MFTGYVFIVVAGQKGKGRMAIIINGGLPVDNLHYHEKMHLDRIQVEGVLLMKRILITKIFFDFVFNIIKISTKIR